MQNVRRKQGVNTLLLSREDGYFWGVGGERCNLTGWSFRTEKEKGGVGERIFSDDLENIRVRCLRSG